MRQMLTRKYKYFVALPAQQEHAFQLLVENRTPESGTHLLKDTGVDRFNRRQQMVHWWRGEEKNLLHKF